MRDVFLSGAGSQAKSQVSAPTSPRYCALLSGLEYARLAEVPEASMSGCFCHGIAYDVVHICAFLPTRFEFFQFFFSIDLSCIADKSASYRCGVFTQRMVFGQLAP